MKFRTIFTHVIGSIHIAPCPTDLQTPRRGPTQLANDHRPPATSSLAHWLTAHRLTDLYCPTGSPAHRLTGSPAHWPPATSHQPPTNVIALPRHMCCPHSLQHFLRHGRRQGLLVRLASNVPLAGWETVHGESNPYNLQHQKMSCLSECG